MKNEQTTAPATPETEYITITEYCRRMTAIMQKNNPTASGPSFNTVKGKIDAGYIKVKKEGGGTFIDWNKYKSFTFKSYRQGPENMVVLP